MANQRQYLLVSSLAYAGATVTPEFIACFGQIYEPFDSQGGGQQIPIENPTLQQYIEALNVPGGKITEVDANGTPMVIVPIPWDAVTGTPAERYAKKVAAKNSLDPIFLAAGTTWGDRWLSESEAQDFVQMYPVGGVGI